MSESKIQELEERLVAKRLRNIEELAGWDGSVEPPTDIVVRLAILQTALTAVRDIIATQQPHVGTGGERPLE
jgi:hypothetical protein